MYLLTIHYSSYVECLGRFFPTIITSVSLCVWGGFYANMHHEKFGMLDLAEQQ